MFSSYPTKRDVSWLHHAHPFQRVSSICNECFRSFSNRSYTGMMLIKSQGHSSHYHANTSVNQGWDKSQRTPKHSCSLPWVTVTKWQNSFSSQLIGQSYHHSSLVQCLYLIKISTTSLLFQQQHSLCELCNTGSLQNCFSGSFSPTLFTVTISYYINIFTNRGLMVPEPSKKIDISPVLLHVPDAITLDAEERFSHPWWIFWFSQGDAKLRGSKCSHLFCLCLKNDGQAMKCS